jgi:hypothetical protein
MLLDLLLISFANFESHEKQTKHKEIYACTGLSGKGIIHFSSPYLFDTTSKTFEF